MKYHKVKWDQVPSIDQVDQTYLQQLNKRNHFHNFPVNQWFKGRSEHVKPQYLYYPEERRLQMELKQIFMTLDCHNEGVLSLAHMFMLFKHYGYSISSNDLQSIYQYIDYNKDKALSLDEFKGLTENPDALSAFRNMMTKIQNTMKDDKYIPLSVGAMLSHISYLVQREKQLKIILSESSISVKFQAFRQLIQETEKKTVADEAFQLYLKAQAEFYKKLKRQNTIDLNIKIRKSFSTVSGLQPLLFRNMLMRDATELQDLAQMLRMQSKVKIDSFESVSEAELEESSLSNIGSNELEQVIQKAKKNGKKQAQKEIKQLLSQRQSKGVNKISQHKKQLSATIEDLPPVNGYHQKCHSTKNKSMLERQLKLQKLILVDDISQFNFLSSTRSNKNGSTTLEPLTSYENQGGWSNRILSQKLPTLQ